MADGQEISLSSEHYQAKLVAITAIKEDDIKKPTNIPISIYIQEAEALYKWAVEDKTELTNRNIPWELVTDLPARIGALRQAQALWIAERHIKNDAIIQWEIQYPAAFQLRNELLSQFRFAYRNDPEIRAQLKSMKAGIGKARMIQNLQNLSRFGKTHPEPLEQTNFDMTLLDRAENLVMELSRLYAAASVDRDTPSETIKIRDQAYTHLKEAVDTIRNFGQHIFRGDKKRKKGYRSEYIRRKEKRLRAKAAEKKAENQNPKTDMSATETENTAAEGDETPAEG